MKWKDVRMGDVFLVDPRTAEPGFAGKTYMVVGARDSAVRGDHVLRVLMSDGEVLEWVGEGSTGYYDDFLLARCGRG